MVGEVIPIEAIPNNIYMLIYLLVALAIGPAGMAILKAVRDYKRDSREGRKSAWAELEDWNHDIVRERNFFATRDRWRGELIGKLEYTMITHPHVGPETVREIRDSMPPEPRWDDEHKGAV
jgi:hypothetical protein